jgi:hypothetical protein
MARRRGSWWKKALLIAGGYEVAVYLWNNYSVNSGNANLPIFPLDGIGAVIGYPTIFPSGLGRVAYEVRRGQ